MAIVLNLSPDVEQGLAIRAQARGLSVHDLLEELASREAAGQIRATPTAEEKALAFEAWARGHEYTMPLSDEAISRENLLRDSER